MFKGQDARARALGLGLKLALLVFSGPGEDVT